MPYVDLEAGLVDPNDQTAATTIITTTTTTPGVWIVVGGGEEEDDLVAIVASLGSLTLVGVLLIVALLLRK